MAGSSGGNGVGVSGSYSEQNGQQSGWGSSVTGSDFWTHNYNDPAITAYTYGLLNNANALPTSTPTWSNPDLNQYGTAALRTGTDASLYNASFGPGHGYDPITGAATVTAGSLATTNLDPYMNPYTRDVIDQNAQDIDRTRLQQLQTVGSNAVSAGAYGGARQALLEGATNEGATRATADMSANLRAQGFTQAQQAAASDLDRRFSADTFNVNQDYQRQAANQGAALTAAGVRQAASGQLASIANNMNGMNYAEFLRQQNYPFQVLDAQGNLVKGLPINKDNFGNTESATNQFGGGDSSKSGWGIDVGTGNLLGLL